MNAPIDTFDSSDDETGSSASDQEGAVKTLAVVSAGTSDPSTTTMLGNKMADRVAALAAQQGLTVRTRVIGLRGLAGDIASAMVTQHFSAALQEASDILRDADGLVVSTPVYKAGASGLFTSFFQVLDNDLLIGTPVTLAATAGSPRHALVVDDQLRGLFAYLRTITAPTSLFAAPDDWTSNELGKRVDRAAAELTALIAAGFRDSVRGEAWSGYQHSFGSAGGSELDIDLDTDLMKLASGGPA